jgi:hypothetical protein
MEHNNGTEEWCVLSTIDGLVQLPQEQAQKEIKRKLYYTSEVILD